MKIQSKFLRERKRLSKTTTVIWKKIQTSPYHRDTKSVKISI
jgi:hypothetical protein